jgi:SAM-dependent methyltransferase
VDVNRFWQENVALAHITPPNVRWPEGFDVIQTLRSEIPDGTVLDFGCGDGRMVGAFEPERYIGVDINAHAVTHCRKAFPEHRFELAGVLPTADTALCYTVLLHVPDDEIKQTAVRLMQAAQRVLVVEILGRKWRGSGLPPVFQREAEEYEQAFSGMRLHSTTARLYRRYGGVEITFLDFRG